MTRSELTELVLSAKRKKGLTWKQIAADIGGASPVLITAALLGQMRLEKAQAEKAASLFGLGAEGSALLQEVPYRGSLPPGPPTDPVVYRFYELLQVYGTTWRELIAEEFGDGIMSAIDFEMSIDRQPDPKGDRVRVTMSGKFLPYRRY
jgi:cyanate lyase